MQSEVRHIENLIEQQVPHQQRQLPCDLAGLFKSTFPFPITRTILIWIIHRRRAVVKHSVKPVLAKPTSRISRRNRLDIHKMQCKMTRPRVLPGTGTGAPRAVLRTLKTRHGPARPDNIVSAVFRKRKIEEMCWESLFH
jgi:hypothetical protein